MAIPEYMDVSYQPALMCLESFGDRRFHPKGDQQDLVATPSIEILQGIHCLHTKSPNLDGMKVDEHSHLLQVQLPQTFQGSLGRQHRQKESPATRRFLLHHRSYRNPLIHKFRHPIHEYH